MEVWSDAGDDIVLPNLHQKKQPQTEPYYKK